MEQKTNALKTASKVISVITKIGYTAMVVMICLCVAMLIFLAVTGGEDSRFTIGGTNIIIFDEASATPAELATLCSVLIVVGGLFFTIFLLAQRMFQRISLTGEPFEDKYARTIRIIGIITAATPIVTGIAEGIASAISGVDMPEVYSDLPGIVVGAIIYCLSYIIDYGCLLRKRSEADAEEKAEVL